MRTTISIDLPLLKKIRLIGHREHKTLTRIIQELLALGVSLRTQRVAMPSPFRLWHPQKMSALIDITDKDAMYKVLDQRP